MTDYSDGCTACKHFDQWVEAVPYGYGTVGMPMSECTLGHDWPTDEPCPHRRGFYKDKDDA